MTNLRTRQGESAAASDALVADVLAMKRRRVVRYWLIVVLVVAALIVLLTLMSRGEGVGGGRDAQLASLTVSVVGLRNDHGLVQGMICTASEQFPYSCVRRASAPAKPGRTSLRFDALRRGEYAFAAFHDENGDGLIDVNARRLPREGFAFSNDAIAQSGVPDFDEAKIEVDRSAAITVKVRYLKGPGTPQ